MTRALLIPFLILIPFIQGTCQSKLIPVSKSELSGIELPVGTKQDKRILSTAAAKTLFQMKAEENATTLENVIEVFSLPPAMKNEVTQAIQKAGWEIQPYTTELTYSLLKKENRMLLVYLESSKQETAFYIMPVTRLKPETPPATQTPILVVQEQTPPHKTASEVERKTQPVIPTSATAFTFTTTNFDDGWVSTIANDFVQVAKGNITVLLYYGFEITDEVRNSTVVFSDYYWNKLVVPAYRVKSAQRLEEGVTYFSTYFIEGEAINPQTGKSCYLALNVLVNSGVASPVLAIAPDRNSYYENFSEPKSLGNMTGYNRFAVGTTDLVGTWEENSSASVNLYNTYTGNYAGMNSTQSSNAFTYHADGTYTSTHSGVSSEYGQTKYFTQEYKGKVTVANWEISMTNRWKDATENFNAQFEAVQGGRILHLQNKAATGIRYHLVRVKK